MDKQLVFFRPNEAKIGKFLSEIRKTGLLIGLDLFLSWEKIRSRLSLKRWLGVITSLSFLSFFDYLLFKLLFKDLSSHFKLLLIDLSSAYFKLLR